MSICLKIHHLIEHSSVNGPGERFVIWTQGCPFHCEGCFNPKTHNAKDGFDINVSQLAQQINETAGIRGITLTGGEPLIQINPLKYLLKLIRKDLDVLLFSGYTLEEIMADNNKKQFLHQIDAALLGRYNKHLPHPFLGKRLVLNGTRIKTEELAPWLNMEVVVNDNNIQITGLYKQSEN